MAENLGTFMCRLFRIFGALKYLDPLWAVQTSPVTVLP